MRVESRSLNDIDISSKITSCQIQPKMDFSRVHGQESNVSKARRRLNFCNVETGVDIFTQNNISEGAEWSSDSSEPIVLLDMSSDDEESSVFETKDNSPSSNGNLQDWHQSGERSRQKRAHTTYECLPIDLDDLLASPARSRRKLNSRSEVDDNDNVQSVINHTMGSNNIPRHEKAQNFEDNLNYYHIALSKMSFNTPENRDSSEPIVLLDMSSNDEDSSVFETKNNSPSSNGNYQDWRQSGERTRQKRAHITYECLPIDLDDLLSSPARSRRKLNSRSVVDDNDNVQSLINHTMGSNNIAKHEKAQNFEDNLNYCHFALSKMSFNTPGNRERESPTPLELPSHRRRNSV